MISLIVAVDDQGGIGNGFKLPWHIPQELKEFAFTTTMVSDRSKQNAVIMGKNTFLSIRSKLKHRLSVIVSSTLTDVPLNNVVTKTLGDALFLMSQRNDIENVFIIGGVRLFQEALDMQCVEHVYLTRVSGTFDCTVFFKPNTSSWQLLFSGPEQTDNSHKYRRFLFRIGTTVSKDHPEYQYLDLVQTILRHGTVCLNRTTVQTLSLFGSSMRFSLRGNQIPLLTTKRVFWRGVVEELLWFIRGDTDAKKLAARGVHIWDPNGSRDALDALGFQHREVGDLGPIYGFQWRHWGAEYTTCHDDYTGKGIDQLQHVIQTIRTNPTDRRMIISAWNVSDLNKMALPPCHLLMQFYVNVAKQELSCSMYQRSCDVGLGVPFNIASYSLLIIAIAHIVGLNPGEFVYFLGDAHMYMNHKEALQEQLKRTPKAFPTLTIQRTVKNIDEFVAEDFVLLNYSPHSKIGMEMTV